MTTTNSSPDLVMRSPDQIERAMADVGYSIVIGRLSGDELGVLVEDARFRDDLSRYWTLHPIDGAWSYYVDGVWSPAPRPTGMLETPVTLPVMTPLISRDESSIEQSTSGARAPLEALRWIVQGTRNAYLQGSITAEQTRMLISQYVITDRHGRYWTVGFRSGGLHVFSETEWRAAQAPPSPEEIVDLILQITCPNCRDILLSSSKCTHCQYETSPEGRQGLEDLLVGLSAYLSHGADALPEPVADPWRPPENFPYMILACPECGRGDIGPLPACRFCDPSPQLQPVMLRSQ